MEQQKEYAGNYEIIESCKIGRTRVVVGQDLSSEQPYLVAFAKSTAIGIEYNQCMVSQDYLDICELFVDRQRKALDQVRQERRERKSDGIPYDSSVCVENSTRMDYTGQILVLRQSYLSPALRSKEEQLVLAESGFGCRPNASGVKVYCRDCYTGERFYVPRYEILGVMKPECVPKWAAKNVRIFLNEKRKNRENAEAERS